jgi:hypothetical protein
VTGRYYGKNRFAVKAHVSVGQNGLVSTTRRADIILPRDIVSAKNIDNPGGAAHSAKIHGFDAPTDGSGATHGKMQGVLRHWDVIDKERFAGRVFQRTVMGQGSARALG